MDFEKLYKSHRSAFIDGVFIGVCVAYIGKHAYKKLVEKYGTETEAPIETVQVDLTK